MQIYGWIKSISKWFSNYLPVTESHTLFFLLFLFWFWLIRNWFPDPKYPLQTFFIFRRKQFFHEKGLKYTPKLNLILKFVISDIFETLHRMEQLSLQPWLEPELSKFQVYNYFSDQAVRRTKNWSNKWKVQGRL